MVTRVCKLMTESQVTAHFMALTSLPSPKEAAVTKVGPRDRCLAHN